MKASNNSFCIRAACIGREINLTDDIANSSTVPCFKIMCDRHVRDQKTKLRYLLIYTDYAYIPIPKCSEELR